MPVQVDTAYTHCIVRWENTSKDYAVVDLKRAKTAVTTLKIGITILFEGYNRERRRGEILFLGRKKDCFTYGFDIVENDNQLNTYSWSSPPGLREQADEIVQAIHGDALSSFQRTASSSSTASSITVPPKPKRKKLNNKNQNYSNESITFDDNSMPPPSSTSTCPVLPVTVSTTNKNVIVDQTSNSNNQTSGSNAQTNAIIPSTDINSLLEENDSLKEEIKLLREKNLSLQDQLVYQRETSISLPGQETCNYFKSILSMYEQTKDEHSKKAMELGKKLPCTSMELKLAKKPNDAATINNLVKYCFKDVKDVDLKTMSYTSIYAKHPELLDNIYEYVKHIHAPLIITPTRFSGAISLKTRHIRDGEKRKGTSTTSKDKQKSRKKQNNYNTLQDRNEQNSGESNEVLVKDMDSDKENTNGLF